MHKSFPFYIVDFHSALTLPARVRAEWNSSMKNRLKWKLTCASPKTYQNQKSFWISSKQPPNTCRAGWATFFHHKMFSWNTNAQSKKNIPTSLSLFWPTFELSFGQLTSAADCLESQKKQFSASHTHKLSILVLEGIFQDNFPKTI